MRTRRQLGSTRRVRYESSPKLRHRAYLENRDRLEDARLPAWKLERAKARRRAAEYLDQLALDFEWRAIVRQFRAALSSSKGGVRC